MNKTTRMLAAAMALGMTATDPFWQPTMRWAKERLSPERQAEKIRLAGEKRGRKGLVRLHNQFRCFDGNDCLNTRA